MTVSTPEQLLLNVRPRADIRLEDFAVPSYAGVVAALRDLKAGRVCYLWGDEASGRSALLQAFVAEAGRDGRIVSSAGLAELLDHGPDILAGLEQADMLVLDQLEAVAGRRDWEEALFHLYNRAQGRAAMLFAAAGPAAQLGLRLPDLVSRLRQAAVYPLPLPDDELRRQVLQAAATRRGLVLAPDAERYLLERGPRGLGSFLDCLDRLDRLSLRDQRRLTLPFLREQLQGVAGEAG